jgi:long-chain acyl-CoA synthetase
MTDVQHSELTGDLDPARFARVPQVYEHAFQTYGSRPAFTALGHTLSYRDLQQLSDAFCQFLLAQPQLQPGDRIALQLPNILQFPIAALGAMKAGLVLVNTNPLYTAREMAHQFKDSGVKAIVILANFCDKLEQVLPETDIQLVIVTELGDMLPGLRRLAINLGVRYVKRLVPAYRLPRAIPWRAVVTPGRISQSVPGRDSGTETAIILYTGGTTGVAKGAMLTHANLLANMMQLRAVSKAVIKDGTDTIIGPLPLYHTYAFMFHCLAMIIAGNHSVLVPNPRDIDGLIALMRKVRANGFVGINTLYLALCRHRDIGKVDFSDMRFAGAGGMALTVNVAHEWTRITGCEVFEGYGLTECSPVVTVNRPGQVRLGTVGPAVPDTQLQVVDDAGTVGGIGDKGELWVRGPQVMKGYWQNPEATAEAVTPEGWFKTGDYATIDADGYVRIVDRKKDMIIVSGFYVFPSEVEEVVNAHPGVFESAVIGVPSDRTGEAVKLFIVARDPVLDAAAIETYCRENLTAYKVPREILRRELREQELAHRKAVSGR